MIMAIMFYSEVAIPLGITNNQLFKRMLLLLSILVLLKSCSMKTHVGNENETGNKGHELFHFDHPAVCHWNGKRSGGFSVLTK